MRRKLDTIIGRGRRLIAATSAVPGPSFVAHRDALQRVRVQGHVFGARDPVFDVNSKVDAAAWADRMGVRRAAVYAEVTDVADLPWQTLPSRFVLKPVRGAASRGVLLLQRRDGVLQELRTEHALTEGDITTQLRALAESGQVSRELVVEELVEDPRRPGRGPIDWKFTTFFGRVGLAEAKISSAGGAVWCGFDEYWRTVGRRYAGNRLNIDESIPPPVHADELMDLAKRISASIPRPFVRVDLYDSAEGPVFGEITPEPGGPPHFRRDIDHRLGELWEEAEGRLLARAAHDGSISPADAPLLGSALLPLPSADTR